MRSSRSSSLVRPLAVFAAVTLPVLGACGQAEPEWVVHTNPSESWQIEVPDGEWSTQSASVDGLDVSVTFVEWGDDDGVTMSETVIPDGLPFDLDASVEGTVQGMVGSLQSEVGEGSAEVTEISSVEFAGSDARRFTAVLSGDGEMAVVHGQIFLLDGVLSQIFVLDNHDDDPAAVARIMSSLTAL